MSQRKIVVIEPFEQKHIEQMKKTFGNEFAVEQVLPQNGEEAVKQSLKEAEIIVGVPSVELLQNPEVNCPKLKFIQMTWAGADIYTQSAIPFPKDRITVANASGAYGMTISQFIVGQILSLMQNFPAYHTQQLNGKWQRLGKTLSLEKNKVLVFGAGDIGTTTAKRLTGFDCYTIGVCRNTTKQRPYFNELCTLDEAERFLPQADVVVCCIPNSNETAGYLNKQRLNLMKQDAVLVNVGRGNFIDCMALDEVLRNGRLWGAALDVTNPEPLPPEHPLWKNERCVITPHTAGVGFGHLDKTVDLLCKVTCENISRYMNGKEILNSVFV